MRAVPVERLVLFVKAPRIGTVKTRLGRSIGSEKACEAYRILVERVLQNVSSIPAVELRFTPDDAGAEVDGWQRDGWTRTAQGEGDLGARLQRAFHDGFAAGAERVVIIGSDCPETRAADVRRAWKELQTHDVVVGPATDGGYWLIGLRAPQPQLFEGIAWSSDQVLAQTLQRARQLGLRIQLLRILSDVDTAEDWRAFQRSGG